MINTKTLKIYHEVLYVVNTYTKSTSFNPTILLGVEASAAKPVFKIKNCTYLTSTQNLIKTYKE